MSTMPSRQAVVRGPASSTAHNYSCVSNFPVSTDSVFYVTISKAAKMAIATCTREQLPTPRVCNNLMPLLSRSCLLGSERPNSAG
jgi:hypothetical protein